MYILMQIFNAMGRWFEGLPHWFRRLPVTFNWIWFEGYHWFIKTFGHDGELIHDSVQWFVRIGWDFMLFVTVCTFILVLSRLVPRRTR